MISACADGRVSREGLDSRPLSENPCLCVAVPVLYDGGGSGWLLARGWCVWCAAVGRGRARPRGGGAQPGVAGRIGALPSWLAVLKTRNTAKR